MSVSKTMNPEPALVKLAAIGGSLFVVAGIVLGIVIAEIAAKPAPARPVQPATERPAPATPPGSCAICQVRWPGGDSLDPAESPELDVQVVDLPARPSPGRSFVRLRRNNAFCWKLIELPELKSS